MTEFDLMKAQRAVSELTDFLSIPVPKGVAEAAARRAAASRAEFTYPHVDLTRVPAEKIAQTLLEKSKSTFTKDTFARVRKDAVDQLADVYMRAVDDFLSGPALEAVAQRFNSAAEAFVENYKLDLFPHHDPGLIVPADMSAEVFGYWRAATDAHAVMERLVELVSLYIIPEEDGRAYWHRAHAVTFEVSDYDSAWSLANRGVLTGNAVFGRFGAAVRDNYRNGSSTYTLSMPATIEEYNARLDVLSQGASRDLARRKLDYYGD